MRSLFVIVLLISAQLALSFVPSPDQNNLMDELIRLERQYGGHLGVAAKNLDSGETIGYNAAERFPTASAIKFPIMTTFFHLVNNKTIDPTMKVVLTKEDKKPGSGLLQSLSDGTTITLLDAVTLMIVVSDNTATNLVLDRLADSHEARLKVVNDYMVANGLKNTRLLNRLYSRKTKQLSPEAIRYGIGVSAPDDMVLLLEALYNKRLDDSTSCRTMLEIMKQQTYREMIPRLLPAAECKYLEVANKTGSINETKVDVGLVLSDKVNFAIAIFVDKHPDHREDIENTAVLLAAHVARAVWNHFTGITGYEQKVVSTDVDWNALPGGDWLIWRSSAAPFPHKDRMNGYTMKDGTFYPYNPHYCDSSIVVFVPEWLKETEHGSNVIVHFHGHMNDNMGVLEQFKMPQAMIAQKINALLVLPQGPYRARDSFGGKMEDEGGLKRLVEDVLATMRREGVTKTTMLDRLIISAHSGGFRPAAFCLDRGGLNDHITNVFLFDAFYGQHDFYGAWLEKHKGFLTAAYTDHLAKEHTTFEQTTTEEARTRLSFTKTTVDHNAVVEEFFGAWLSKLDSGWKVQEK